MKSSLTHLPRKKINRFLFKHPLGILALTLTAVVFGGGVLTIALQGQTVGPNDSHIVLLSIDGQQHTVPTRSETVGDLLPRISQNIKPEDIVEPALDTPISGDDFRVNIYHAKPVTIVDTVKKTPVVSAYKEPREIVEKSGIEIFPEDMVELKRVDDPLKDGIVGEKVIIKRATPVSINLYGNAITVRTQAKTVGAILEEKNIKPGEGDTVQPALDTPLGEKLQIYLVRVGKQIVTAEEQIKPPVETIDDSTLTIGSSSVRQEGTPGKKLVTYEVELRNNIEVSRRILQEATITEPVKRVVARGTQTVRLTGTKGDWVVGAGIAAGDYQYVDYIVQKESGWNPLAINSSSGAYGLCQALPGNKMASAGDDWRTNPITQLKWCNSYAQTCTSYRNYCGWAGAYSFWLSHYYW